MTSQIITNLFTKEQVQTLDNLFTNFSSDNEFEIRFGKYVSNQFTSGTTKDIVSLIIKSNDIIDNTYKEENEMLVVISNINPNIRVCYKIVNGNIAEKYTEYKERIKNIEFPNYNVRISMSKEINTTSDKNTVAKSINFYRHKIRTSYYTHDKNWRLDVTYTIGKNITDISEIQDFIKQLKSGISQEIIDTTYNLEMELEFIGNKYNNTKELITTTDEFLYKILQLIYPDIIYKKLQNIVYTKLKNILNINPTTNIDFRKNLISNVQTLEFHNITELETQDWGITIKADGERNLLFIDNNLSTYLINSRNEIIDISKSVKNLDQQYKNTIIDCEIINSTENLILAFDLLVCKGENYMSKSLIDRLTCLKSIISDKETPITIDNFKFKLKKFCFKDNENLLSECIETIWNTKYKYEIDGIIFTPNNSSNGYKSLSYKWKPVDMLTIDFLIKKVSEDNFNMILDEMRIKNTQLKDNTPSLKNTSSSTTAKEKKSSQQQYFLLFVGASLKNIKSNSLEVKSNTYNTLYKNWFPNVNQNTNYRPMLFIPHFMFTSSDKQIMDDTIIELYYKDSQFHYTRTRDDRTNEYLLGNPVYGNSWTTATSNWRMIQKPLTYDMLIGKEKIPFFANDRDSTLLKSMKKFHNYIKKTIYQKYTKDTKRIFEFAIGRFNDIFKWTEANIKTVYGIDIDENAIIEGESFIESLIAEGKLNEQTIPKMKVHIMDARTTFDQINLKFENKLKPNFFDTVSCQFGIHFFMESEEVFMQFCNNVATLLKENGTFIATCLNGLELNNLLNENEIEKDQTFDIKKNNTKIISITKQYGNTTNIDTYGNKISIYIESIGSLNEEYIVSPNLVISTFRKFNIDIKIIPFKKYFKTWGKEMSQEEKIYSFLGMVIIGKHKTK